MEKTQRYLVHFFKKWKYLDFCIPELESLAEMYGADIHSLYDKANPKSELDMKRSTCIYVNLPSDEVAKQIQARSIMIKEILHPFSQSHQNF
jgi:hypothetical protein